VVYGSTLTPGVGTVTVIGYAPSVADSTIPPGTLSLVGTPAEQPDIIGTPTEILSLTGDP